MATSNELRAQRANIWEQMKATHDRAETEKRDLTVEERKAWDDADKDLDRLDAAIADAEKYEARNKAYTAVDRSELRPGGQVAPKDEKPGDAYAKVFTKYLKNGMVRLTAAEQDVLATGFTADADIQNALSVGTTTAGGYLVPPGWRQEFIVQMLAYGNVQQEAQVIYTDSGQPIQWPTMNDTTNTGRLLAENTQMTQTDVVLGTATLGAYVHSSDLTLASLQLVNDSAFDVDALVQRAHAERIGRGVNSYLTTGTGSSQPQGIVTGATSGVTAAGVAAITADEVIDLVHSVDPAYRNSSRAKFMLSDAALKLLRKLKDTTNQYLWQPGLQAGVASQLYGYPVTINPQMAVPATGVKSVLFGDFYAGYVVRIVNGIQTITFTERYMDFLQIGHASFMRYDGKTQNASAYKALTQA